MNFSAYFKSLQFISLTIMSSTIIAIIAAYYISLEQTYDVEMQEMGSVFLIIGGILILGGFFSSRFLKSKVLKKIKNADNYKKLIAYKTLTIINFAIFEAIGFFIAIFLFLSGLTELLFVAMGVLLLMTINFPNKTKLKGALSLTENALREIDFPKTNS